MAHFYGSMQGGRRETETTRTGTKASGISAHVRGWNVGVSVSLEHAGDHGPDRPEGARAAIGFTSGSNGSGMADDWAVLDINVVELNGLRDGTKRLQIVDA